MEENDFTIIFILLFYFLSIDSMAVSLGRFCDY